MAAQWLELNRQSRRAAVEGQEILLTARAFTLLEYIMLHPDEVLSRERLLYAVWGWDDPAPPLAAVCTLQEAHKARKPRAGPGPGHASALTGPPGAGTIRPGRARPCNKPARLGGSMIAAQETALFDFDRAEDTARWQPLNDTVMGGLSESELRPSGQGTALFAGNVSLENYGGFASVRSEPERLDLSAYQGLALRVRGDGKRYQIRVRTGASPDGVDYASGFDTKAGEWLRSHLPFSDMVATYRGEAVPDAPPLDRSQVYSVGLLIADRQEGPFALEVAWIGAYRA